MDTHAAQEFGEGGTVDTHAAQEFGEGGTVGTDAEDGGVWNQTHTSRGQY